MTSPPIPETTARRVRLVVLDVDGTLTDGGIYIGVGSGNGSEAPIELKRFHVEDGIAVRMMRKAGLEVAIVSGRMSSATALRAAELGIPDVHQDHNAHKMPAMKQLMAAKEVEWEEVAIIGDDLADLPLMRKAGLPATVANGVPEIRRAAVWQSVRRGGQGAVREFAEALLRARGQWDELVDEYCRERES